MAIGNLILLVAFIDEFVLELRGRRCAPATDGAARNE
jgi:hypothetical protein